MTPQLFEAGSLIAGIVCVTASLMLLQEGPIPLPRHKPEIPIEYQTKPAEPAEDKGGNQEAPLINSVQQQVINDAKLDNIELHLRSIKRRVDKIEKEELKKE